ncbi:hypothetical protein D3C87_1185140 [compost metagenome]
MPPPQAHVGLVTGQGDALLQTGFNDARQQAVPFRAVAEHHGVQLRVLLTQRNQRIEKQVGAFFTAQAPDVSGQPALTLCVLRLQVVGRRQAVGDHLQLLRPHTGLAVQHGNAFGDADHAIDRRGAAQLQAQPGVELLLATARRETVLRDYQRQAQQGCADPAEQQALEIVRIDQRPLGPPLAQMRQQRPQPRATATVDPGLAKPREQLVRCIEKQHLMLPRRRQAVVEQHALGPIEATTAEQMNDRQGWLAVQGRVQLRTQWTKLGTLQFRCGLLGSTF